MVDRFEILDHTADVGISGFGHDMAEAFAQAALGMFSVITDLELIRERESRHLTVAAPDREALLVNWLNDLLYLFETEGFLFARFAIDSVSNTKLDVQCFGERVDPGRHPMNIGVKAATYHMIEVTQNGAWHIQVYLDV